ncbi:hypothetical protein LY76DRAFT_591043 [Colletotrichum caudatum]|nr:hypothetical protein LY76DRAFT_591043 [Colletotrichum caudatum]
MHPSSSSDGKTQTPCSLRSSSSLTFPYQYTYKTRHWLEPYELSMIMSMARHIAETKPILSTTGTGIASLVMVTTGLANRENQLQAYKRELLKQQNMTGRLRAAVPRPLWSTCMLIYTRITNAQIDPSTGTIQVGMVCLLCPHWGNCAAELCAITAEVFGSPASSSCLKDASS